MADCDDFVSRRELLSRQLERIDRAIDRWDEYEANERLPLVRRRHLPKPRVARSVLEQLHATLFGALLDYHEAWERRN